MRNLYYNIGFGIGVITAFIVDTLACLCCNEVVCYDIIEQCSDGCFNGYETENKFYDDNIYK